MKTTPYSFALSNLRQLMSTVCKENIPIEIVSASNKVVMISSAEYESLTAKSENKSLEN